MTLKRIRTTRQRALAVVAGVFTVAMLASCTATTPGSGGTAGNESQSMLERAKEDGYLRVAIANEPPYTQVNADGTVTGAEPDVLRAVLKTMGIDDIQGVVTPYESMIPGLDADRWDVVAAGLFMKESRSPTLSRSSCRPSRLVCPRATRWVSKPSRTCSTTVT